MTMQTFTNLHLALIQRTGGKLNEEEFKRVRLLNGLYLQLHSYMLRVAIPNGELSGQQLMTLAVASQKYDRGYFHITTRQNVQFNWISLHDAPQISAALSKVNLLSTHTAGNCVRQIVCDPTHDFAVDEQVNINETTHMLRQQFCLNPIFSNLPRKVKICVRGNISDNIASAFHDVGIRLMGDKAFISIGGGLGRSPQVAIKFIKLHKDKLAIWLATFLRTYTALSHNLPPMSRIKVLVRKYGKLTLIRFTKNLDDIKTAMPRFCPVKYIIKEVNIINWNNDDNFIKWFNAFTEPNRQKYTRHIELNCSSNSSPPGDIVFDDVKDLCILAQRYSLDQIRLTTSQTLLLPCVNEVDLTSAYNICKKFIPTNVACCPGLDYCSLANTRSITIAQKLIALNCNLKIRVSGCVNGCSQHHIFDVGVIGVRKGGREHYQIMVGGHGPSATLGKVMFKALPPHKVVGAVLWFNNIINLLRKDYAEDVHLCVERNEIKPNTTNFN